MQTTASSNMLRKLSTAAASVLSLLVVAFLFYALLIRPDLFYLALATAVLVTLAAIVLRLVASLAHRIRAGKFIFPPRFPNALFHEWWISSRGHEKLLFQLTKEEFEDWRSQFVMSNLSTKMGRGRAPCAFTEQRGRDALERAEQPAGD
jgi:hypothetical protein